MFLIQKGKERKVTSEYCLKWRLEQGWTLIKPLHDFPKRISYIKVKHKSIPEMVWWYQDKIEELEKQLKSYKEDLDWINKNIV